MNWLRRLFQPKPITVLSSGSVVFDLTSDFEIVAPEGSVRVPAGQRIRVEIVAPPVASWTAAHD